MIRAIRPSAVARDDAAMITGWNVSPNVGYTVVLTPGASACGVLLFDADMVALVASGSGLVGTDQPVILLPQTGQVIGMVDAELGWHLLVTTDGTEAPRLIRIGPAVDLPDEIHPVYTDDSMALARATAAINSGASYVDDVTVACPLGIGGGIGAVASAPVDGVAVVGQVESVTWSGTPDGTIETAVIRRHTAIAPEAFVEIIPPTVADDAGETDAATIASGNVLTNDGADLTVVAVDGLAANVGEPVAGSDGGQFVINEDGSWTFDPDGDFAALSGSETADTSVTYHASDGVSESSATVTVAVSAVQGVQLWTPAEITTSLWLDDSGLHGVDFDGSALHTTDSITLPTVCSIFVALDTSTTSDVQIATEHSANYNSNNGSWLITVGETAGAIRFGFYNSSSWYVVQSPVSSGKMSLSLISSGFKSIAMYNHGSLLTNTVISNTLSSLPANTLSRPVYVRGRAGNVYPLSGPVREEIILPGAASADVRQRIEGYIAHKWDGILGETARVAALPADHPYKSAPPTV